LGENFEVRKRRGYLWAIEAQVEKVGWLAATSSLSVSHETLPAQLNHYQSTLLNKSMSRAYN
jgi:hypothetical protein